MKRWYRTATSVGSRRAMLLAGALLVLVSAGRVGGRARHEIPVDVTVQIYVRPVGERLQVLIRVPLRAMRDMEFPLVGPGYLDLGRADAELRTAAQLWLGDELRLFEGGIELSDQALVAARASVPSDRSFGTFQTALAQVTGDRLPGGTELFWQNAMLDALFEYEIRSASARFAIEPNLARLAERVTTVLRFVPPDGVVRALQYRGDPGRVALDPSWWQASWRFVVLGFEHILDGVDHLLFLLALVIPFRRLIPVVVIATAFTVAHSVTLIGSSLGLAPSGLWFPPLIETLIAASIVYMALENVVGAQLSRRWAVALGFGLVHGFGFSFALQESLQFAGSHLVSSLLAFNVGVELGQIVVLVLLVPILELLCRRVVKERIGIIILSAFVAHTGWHWMTQRAAILSGYDRPWWAFGSAWPWLVVAVGLAALGWVTMHRERTAPG